MSYGEHFDANAMEIANNLRVLGVSVAHVKASHANSVGVFDSVCGYRGRSHLVEFKVLGKGLRSTQIAFATTWNGCMHVATNSDEAFALIRACHERRSPSVTVQVGRGRA